MAERARFELAVSCPTLVFKTSTINHSVTSPELAEEGRFELPLQVSPD
jgi:hypothetical protein